MEELLNPFRSCQITIYHLFSTPDASVWSTSITQASSNLLLPVVVESYLGPSSNEKSHFEVYRFHRWLSCFLTILNLTAWRSKKYFNIPLHINAPGRDFNNHISFMLLAMERVDGGQDCYPIFKNKANPFKFPPEKIKKQLLSTILRTGIPALSPHPARLKTMWSNMLRLIYSYDASSNFHINQLSLVVPHCGNSDALCFKSARKLLEVSSSHQLSLHKTIHRFRLDLRNIFRHPIYTMNLVLWHTLGLFWTKGEGDASSFAISRGYETIRKLFYMYQAVESSDASDAKINVHMPITKAALELVGYINGTLSVSSRNEDLEQITNMIYDNVPYIDSHVYRAEGAFRGTGTNNEQYNFMYCSPTTEIFHPVISAFVIPFDKTTWILVVISVAVQIIVLCKIYGVPGPEAITVSLRILLSQGPPKMTIRTKENYFIRGKRRRMIMILLLYLSGLVLSTIYVCFIEALVTHLSKTVMKSMQEVIEAGYKISIPGSGDENWQLDAILRMQTFGISNYDKLQIELTNHESIYSPELHKHIMLGNRRLLVWERPMVKVVTEWVNERFEANGTTCIAGTEPTRLPSDTNGWAFSGVSSAILLEALVKIQESGILNMLMKIHESMLEAYASRSLRRWYSKTEVNGKEAHQKKGNAKSKNLFSLQNPQGVVVFKMLTAAILICAAVFTWEIAQYNRYFVYRRLTYTVRSAFVWLRNIPNFEVRPIFFLCYNRK